MTLLEQALHDKRTIGRSKWHELSETEKQERIELALAWLCGDVTTTAAGRVLQARGSTNGAIYVLALTLKEAYRVGKLSIVTRIEDVKR